MVQTIPNPKHWRVMLAIGLGLGAAGLLAGQPRFSLGALLATGLSLLAQRWVVTPPRPDAPPDKAIASLLGRAMARTLAFVVLLLIAAPFGHAFLFGVLAGLALDMLAYLLQALFSVRQARG